VTDHGSGDGSTRRRAPRWGLGDCAVGAIPLALSGLTLLAGGGSDTAEITVATLVASSLFLWAFLGGVPVVATRLKGNGVVADLGLRFRTTDLGAFVLGAGLQALAVPALYWPLFRFTDLGGDDVSGDARDLTSAATGIGLVALVLVVCVGAPLVEELFYRGLLLRSLERRWGTTVAWIGSTLVFAGSHLQGIQLPALVLFGAVAGWLAVRTGRLGPGILCHAGFNAWTVLELLVLHPTLDGTLHL
jgi:membrane protease YdiL (CAAX protease family)